MPIFLRDFISIHHGKAGVDPLIEKIYRQPPLAQDTITSEYYSDKYKKLIESPTFNRAHTKVIKLILEYLIANKAPEVMIKGQTISFFQQNLLPEQLAVFLRAFLFELTNIGNCSNRAGYAAFKLHEIFEDTPLKVAIKSAEKIDQFVVYLGNKSMGWFIYDPLTNPDLVFTHEEYLKNIMIMFKPHPTPKTPVTVFISTPLREQYQNVIEKFTANIAIDIDRLDATKLKQNPNIIFSIARIDGIKNIELSLDLACKELREEYGEHVFTTTSAALPNS